MQVSTRGREPAFAALLLGMLVAQLEGTVVVAALPAIGADLGQPEAAPGVFTVSLLAVTVSTPVHGAMGDRYGRRAMFVAALLLFTAGSLASAFAPTFPALLAARAVQGIGGGGLVVTAISAIGELFDAHERIGRQIWSTAVFGVSALAGPPLGGMVAAAAGWRWVFALPLPLCAAALALGWRAVPGQRGRRSGAFDVAGATLVALGGAALVTLGSSDALGSNPLWSPLLAGAVVVCAVAFVRVERRAAHPLVPPALFAVGELARAVAVTALSGVALFGTFAFVPLALATGLGAGTALTGALLLALTGGQLAASTAFSVLARRRRRLAPWGRLSLALGIAGLGLLAALPRLAAEPAPLRYAVAVAGLASAGAALGLGMAAYTLLGMGLAPVESMGAAMGTLMFARQLGGSLGAAGFGWVLLAAPDPATGLTAVLAVAAAVTAVAFVVAPRGSTVPSAGA
ncbi:MFS transporter [Pseudonocardia adelaidensis]|uniref:MFS transporter n=1 Tax=Pseudonocardia adelaidensis TaxID=648754 RepID=A0ABP9NZD3_9PSEU